MKKTYYFIISILIIITLIRYVDLYYLKHDKYLNEYLNLTNKIVYGPSAPRGRIYDRNGILLVDNKGTNTITYRKIKNNNDLNIAKELVDIIEIEEASIEDQKKYYLNTNNTDYLLTTEEIKLIEYRKLSQRDIEKIKLSRIDKEINNYSTIDKKIINIYTLMNKGYSYSNKIIKEEATKEECANINSLNLPGLTCEYHTTRKYLNDSIKPIIGTIGKITSETKEEYLDKGYSLNDIVGTSYIEKQYEEYLRGEKAVYKVNKDNSLTLIKEEKRGNDLYLSIDIKLQQEIDNIIKKYLDKKDNYKKTEYYNTSYVIVSNPNTGEIIASTGINKINNEYHNVTTNILTSSFTVGSVIKGASHTVGYQNNLIEEGKKINDSCVKLYQVPQKCSYKKLGYIDDITALKTSSNYYQFMTAIKLTGNKYKNNMKLNAKKEHFDTYRNTFKEFGLGTTTGIDLENESIGIKGNIISDDLLLNLSIGQYDTYTPLQLTNYINTIATSGNRYSLHYISKIKDTNNLIYEYNPKKLNTIKDTGYFSRIKEGFKEVLYTGTGRGYTDLSYKPAGKTGTSEVVYNKDTITINQTYAMFAPYDNPEYSIVVISPNISYNTENDTYIAPINRYISKEVSKLVFEK